MEPVCKDKYVYMGEKVYIDGYLHHWVRSKDSKPHYRINYTESRRKAKNEKYKNCYFLPCAK